ncbi:MAG TPA: class I adenylate-forming enzyme family protein, partial [Gemmataceae bacterium]|nr:class I adenylate-forming enzyme family protein [Gemmataceae bacterium]
AMQSVGKRLENAGVGPGSVVGLHVPSGRDYILLTFALWRCGACVAPIPVELALPEKTQFLRTVALDFVLTQEGGASFLDPVKRGTPAAILPHAQLWRVQPGREHPPGFAAINSAFIRFTSGTTAAAKGVVLSHETIHERIEAADLVLRLGPSDRILWLLSMAYHFAVSIVGYLSKGSTVVLLPNHFAPAIVAAAQRWRTTLMYGAPAHYVWLAGMASPPRLPDLRLAISTTAPLDGRAAQAFREKFGLPVTQALGIIEVGLPFINTDFANQNAGAVGRVVPAYQLRLEDTGLGEGLKEILLAGPGFLDAYYEPWRVRSEIMPTGWFHTGDVGTIDEDGCVVLRGRTKDLISVLGLKFFPQEVESVLTQHPAIQAANVFARTHSRLGEVPSARVVLRPGLPRRPSEAEIVDYCRQRLAHFKVPERIEFVDALPKTASGKVLHRDFPANEGTTRERP